MKYPITCLTAKTKNSSHSEAPPEWFLDNKAIRETKEITKAFDTLGLKPFTALGKLDDMVSFKSKIEGVNSYFAEELYLELNDISLGKIAEANIQYILSELEDNISSDYKIKKAIKNELNQVIFKAGTSIKLIIKNLLSRTKVINYKYKGQYKDELNDLLDCYPSSSKENHRIVFSTHPWDILTMSMRGINSCMDWDSPHSQRLIGSVLCPYVGIIYATNGAKTPYGEWMTYRSVVRLVKHKTKDKDKFHLYVEGAYNKIENNCGTEDPDLSATNMFRNVLAKKINGNKNILSVVEFEKTSGYYVPFSPAIQNISPQIRTCFDSELIYQ